MDVLLSLFRRTYLFMVPLLCFALPTYIPIKLWGEDPWVSWYVAAVWRYTLSLNLTWLVNSVAHIWGNRPYDKSIGAANNTSVANFVFGEALHNYHHVFPWDYKSAEFGDQYSNMTTGFLDMCAYLGLAYDLKSVSNDLVRKRVERTGDGTHPWIIEKADNLAKNLLEGQCHPENPIWGWEDTDMTEEDKKCVQFRHKRVE